MRLLRRGLRKTGQILLGTVLAGLHAWALLALYFWFMGPSAAALILCGVYAFAVWGSFRLAKTRGHGAMVSLMLFLVVAVWWTRRVPEKDLAYSTETVESARITTDLNLLTVSGLRQFRYRSVEDFDERWHTQSYDLEKLQYVDLYFVHWGIPGVAHAITSFVFQEGPPLAVSIELRREKGEENTLLRGFFKQYEIHYVWSDEPDLIKLRTNYRHAEEVYLHRTSLTPEQGKKMLRSMAARTNWLADHPEFYNTLTDSCASAISLHLMQAMGRTEPLFGRRFSPAAYEKQGYREGWLLHAKPDFQADREASHINARARAINDDNDFSTRIRTHLPTPPVQPSYGSGSY